MSGRPLRSRKPPAIQPEQQTRAKWTTMLTQVFADVMVDHVHKGNRLRSSFTKQAWESISEEFYKRTGMRWDKEQLKSRHSSLKKQYTLVKSLLVRNDFSWEESTGAIIAEDNVWDDYIKDHPEAETLRTAGCPIFKQLDAVFGGTQKTDNLDESTENLGGDSSTIPCPDPVSFHQEVSSMDPKEAAEEREKSHRKRGRKGVEDAMADAILKMAAASRLRTRTLQQYNERFSIADSVKALDEITDLDDAVYYAALDLFNSKPVTREVFLSLKPEKRLLWLEGKCKLHTLS